MRTISLDNLSPLVTLTSGPQLIFSDILWNVVKMFGIKPQAGEFQALKKVFNIVAMVKQLRRSKKFVYILHHICCCSGVCGGY